VSILEKAMNASQNNDTNEQRSSSSPEKVKRKISKDEKPNKVPRHSVSVEKTTEVSVEEEKVQSEEKTGGIKIENAANQNYDEMVVWFQLEGGFSMSTAKAYASLLIDNDIATIAKLKRKLKRNENILVQLGIKSEDAEDLLDVLIESIH
jgi:hypothetical protein